MSEFAIKKFLDAEGLKALWGEIPLKDYPKNDTLAGIIKTIDEVKADKSVVNELIDIIGEMDESIAYISEENGTITDETTLKGCWLVDHEQTKIAPKTLSTQILNKCLIRPDLLTAKMLAICKN